MKLTLESYGKTTTIEWPRDDLGIEEVIDAMKAMLASAGFHRDTIDAEIPGEEVEKNA